MPQPSPSATPTLTPVAGPSLPMDQAELLIVNADGSGLTKLHTEPDNLWGVQWSRDGRYLAFVSHVDGSRSALYVLDVSGGPPRAILDPGKGRYAQEFLWSPKGDWIAVPDDSWPLSRLYLVRPDESEKRRVKGHAWPLAWLPDGSSLLVKFQEEVELGTGEPPLRQSLGILDVATLEVRPIAPMAFDWPPFVALSADGQWLAYWARSEAPCGRYNVALALWIVRVDGSERRQVLEPTCGQLGSAAWSPDGSQIAYVNMDLPDPETREEVARGIYVVDLRSGAVRWLSRPGRYFDIQAQWLAGGRYLLVGRVNCISCEPSYYANAIIAADGSGEVGAWEASWQSYAPSPDGHRLAIGSVEGQLLVLAVDDWQPVVVAEGKPLSFHSLAWSPDGRRLAFVRSPLGQVVYTAAVDGTDLRLLPLSAKAQGIALSPDWGYVAFPLEDKLYVARSDGSQAWPVAARFTYAVLSPEWSPDSERLVFIRAHQDGERKPVAELVEVKVDGSGTRAIVEVDNSVSPFSLVWSLDGRRLAWQEGWMLRVIDVETGEVTELAREAGDPAWSPDSSRIAFSTRDGLTIITADGSQREVISTRSWPRAVGWSPDGRRLAFVYDDQRWGVGNVGLYVINVDGSGERLLFEVTTDGAAFDVEVSTALWSPDGQRLAFAARREWSVGIFIANADSSGAIELARSSSGRPVRLLGWSPDGLRIAFVTFSPL